MLRWVVAALALTVVLLFVGCQGLSPTLGEAVPIGCPGCSTVSEIRAAYAANPLRAENTYVGERMLIGGRVKFFGEHKGSGLIFARFENGARITQGRVDGGLLPSTPSDEVREWREWLLSKSIGDVIQAECLIVSLASPEGSPTSEPGTPGTAGCKRLTESGEVVTRPAPTPTRPAPTPILGPCVEMEFVGGSSRRVWLKIDCPEGTVTVGRDSRPAQADEFKLFSEGDSTIVSYHLIVERVTGTYPYKYHSPWKRWTEEIWRGTGIREVWEAPPERASHIIQRWREGALDLELYFGECCQMGFALDRNSN